MNRKRKRATLLVLCGCLPLACSFQAFTHSRLGFSLVTHGQEQRISGLYSVSSTASSLAVDEAVQKESTKQSTKDDHFDLPPWLSHYAECSEEQVKEQIQWLEYNLMEQGFLVADIMQLVEDVNYIATEDTELAAGLLDFLRLLLSLRQDESGALFVTTPVLLASIIHYTECVSARRRGMPNALRDVLLRQVSLKKYMSTQRTPLSLPGVELLEESDSIVTFARRERPLGLSLAPESSTVRKKSPYEPEVDAICKGAARVKRAECLAHAILQNHVVTPNQASRLRDLYLTCMDEDWRSLALRVVACLYRLEGSLRTGACTDTEYVQRNPQVVQTAREAMRIYAPLAQRLGMHRLKAMIEERAFRLQYRRQYKAVSSLYQETGPIMKSVAAYLQSHVQQLLQNDEALVEQLKTLQVAVRVKEPYSFWRKLLKKRVKGLLKPSSSINSKTERDRRTLSVTEVNDVVALRVVLTARKLSPEEPEDVTRTREQMLCYYVQHLIRSQWPEIDTKRLKDYIANPKPNGYQSLHHTSQIASRGIKFPFEVQVRSAAMHAQAEYGISAHWDYKLSGNAKTLSSANPTKALKPYSYNGTTVEIMDDISLGSSSAVKPVMKNYVDALVTARENMLRNKVYVFIMGDGNEGNEQAELISVPANSSIENAITEIENIIPAKVQVWRNGRLADKADSLENGDVVMIAV